MKHYNLETQFTFGKYKGSTMHSVALKYPNYLEWCALNLNHFVVFEEDRMILHNECNNFIFSDQAIRLMEQRIQENKQRLENHREALAMDEENHETYDDYAGSYAQDVMGYSDDVINDAFEGDPDMYWNID